MELLLLFTFWHFLSANCSPITLCSTTELTDIKNTYLNAIIEFDISSDSSSEDSSPDEEPHDLLAQYQSKAVDIFQGVLHEINETKTYISADGLTCLSELENSIVISQQKVNAKLESKGLKIREKIVSAQAKHESKLSAVKMKANKAVEKCASSSSSCNGITSCFQIAVQKLDLLKLEILEDIGQLHFKHVQVLEEIYEGAVGLGERFRSQLAICSPPRPKTSTTSQPLTQQPEVIASSSEEINEPISVESTDTTIESDSSMGEEATTSFNDLVTELTSSPDSRNEATVEDVEETSDAITEVAENCDTVAEEQEQEQGQEQEQEQEQEQGQEQEQEQWQEPEEWHEQEEESEHWHKQQQEQEQEQEQDQEQEQEQEQV